MKKLKKHTEATVTKAKVSDEGPAAVLLLAGLGVGIYAWLRSRRQVEAVARQFRQMPVNLNRSPAIKRRDDWESYPIWSPEFSHHWRG